MKFFMVLGVVVWVWIAVWLVRLGMGLEHLSKDQLLPGIVGGIGGGVAGWYVVARQAKKRAAGREA